MRLAVIFSVLVCAAFSQDVQFPNNKKYATWCSQWNIVAKKMNKIDHYGLRMNCHVTDECNGIRCDGEIDFKGNDKFPVPKPVLANGCFGFKLDPCSQKLVTWFEDTTVGSTVGLQSQDFAPSSKEQRLQIPGLSFGSTDFHAQGYIFINFNKNNAKEFSLNVDYKTKLQLAPEKSQSWPSSLAVPMVTDATFAAVSCIERVDAAPPKAGQCRPVPPRLVEEKPLVLCKRVLCELHCHHGYITDENGCDLCICKDAKKIVNPCENRKCANNERCVRLLGCEMNTDCSNASTCIPHDHNMVERKPKLPCPEPMCANFCPLGYKNNDAGCMTCNCKEKVCDQHTCPEGQTCRAQGRVCPEMPCRVYPACSFPPVCHMRRNSHMDVAKQLVPGMTTVMSVLAPPLDCEENGDFAPKQCAHGECWCVDDRGQELEESRIAVATKDDEPNCMPRKTQKIFISFHLRHQVPRNHIQKQVLKEVIHKHIRETLLVKGNTVRDIQVITERKELIKVTLFVERDDVTDLSAVAAFMTHKYTQSVVVIKYRTWKLKVEPQSLHIVHHYRHEPKVIACWFGGFRHMPTSTMIICAFLVLSILLSICACCCACKKYRRRASRARAAAMFQHKALTNQPSLEVCVAEDSEKPPLTGPMITAESSSVA